MSVVAVGQRNSNKLERVQKAAVRVIMGSNHFDYKTSLKTLKMSTLKNRRKILSLKFAKKCTKNDKTKQMFPKRKEVRKQIRRKTEKYEVTHTKTKRLAVSAIPYMQKLLNEDNLKLRKEMKILNKPTNKCERN